MNMLSRDTTSEIFERLRVYLSQLLDLVGYFTHSSLLHEKIVDSCVDYNYQLTVTSNNSLQVLVGAVDTETQKWNKISVRNLMNVSQFGQSYPSMIISMSDAKL